jgi:hypothetical protein
MKRLSKCPHCAAMLQPWEIRGAGSFGCPYCETRLQASNSYGRRIDLANLLVSAAVFLALGLRGLHLVLAVVLVWWPVEFLAINLLIWVLPPHARPVPQGTNA